MEDIEDKLMAAYQEEMKRHQKALEDIFNKYCPGYDKEEDRR